MSYRSGLVVFVALIEVQHRFNLPLVPFLRQLSQSQFVLSNLGHFAKFLLLNIIRGVAFSLFLLLIRRLDILPQLSLSSCHAHPRVKSFLKDGSKLLFEIDAISFIRLKKAPPEWICLVRLQFLHSLFELLRIFAILTRRSINFISPITFLVNDDVDNVVEVLLRGHLDILVLVNFTNEVVEVVNNFVLQDLELA